MNSNAVAAILAATLVLPGAALADSHGHEQLNHSMRGFPVARASSCLRRSDSQYSVGDSGHSARKPINFDEKSQARVMTLSPGDVISATYAESAAIQLEKLAR